MTDLQVTARLVGPVCLPGRSLMLDALLVYSVCLEAGMTLLDASHAEPVPIPLKLDRCGFYHCTQAIFHVEQSELRHTNRRPPVEQYQTLATTKMRRCQISLGVNKAYRIPRNLDYPAGGEIVWCAVGIPTEVERLLGHITHLGKRRGVGWGKVGSWSVTETNGWGKGFPVIRDGKPQRSLPLDYPGLVDPPLAYAVPTPPYWDRTREQLMAVPSWS